MASAAAAVGSSPSEVPAPLRDSSEELVGEALRGSLRSLPPLVGQLNLEDVVKINIDWSKLEDMSLPQPMLLFSALQQHVSSLQPFMEKLQALIKEEQIILTDNKTEDGNSERNSDIIDKDVQGDVKSPACGSANLKESHVGFDPEVVQIKAGKAEIERRILAFIERKQAEINENNVREFCNVIDCNQGSSMEYKVSKSTKPTPGQPPQGESAINEIRERLTNIEGQMLVMQQTLQEILTMLKNLQAAGFRMMIHHSH